MYKRYVAWRALESIPLCPKFVKEWSDLRVNWITPEILSSVYEKLKLNKENRDMNCVGYDLGEHWEIQWSCRLFGAIAPSS
jgi:hypothetical protein